MAGRIILIGTLIQGILCGWNISLPANIEVLNGSCAFIPCTFEIDETLNQYLTITAKRMWYKDAQKVFDSSSPGGGVLSGTIFGTATEKNCTTRFHYVTQTNTGQYYFRLDQSRDLAYTYSKKLQINIKDSPDKPTVSIFKPPSLQQEVMEGTSVVLRCSAKMFCSSLPPAFIWRSSTNVSITGQQRQNQSDLISDLNFTVTHQHHRVNFTCVISYQLENRNTSARESVTLHVQYAPKNTLVFVSPSGCVLEGRSVSLTCSSDGNPAVVNYTWYREAEGQLKTGPDLMFIKTEPKHSGRYYCTAHNKHGTQTSDTIILNITYAPKISKSSCSQNNIITCFCEVDGNPLPTLEWHLSGRPVVNSTSTSIIQEQLGETNFRSTLTVNQALKDTPTLQCVSANLHGIASQQFQELRPASSRFDGLSLLAGVVFGVIVMLIVGIVSIFCMRQNSKPSQTKQDLTGLVMNNVVLDNEDDIYANNAMFSSTEAVTLNASECLHYSSINFINTEATSGEKRDISLATVYAEVRHHTAGETETKNISKINQSTSDTKTKNAEKNCTLQND